MKMEIITVYEFTLGRARSKKPMASNSFTIP